MKTPWTPSANEPTSGASAALTGWKRRATWPTRPQKPPSTRARRSLRSHASGSPEEKGTAQSCAFLLKQKCVLVKPEVNLDVHLHGHGLTVFAGGLEPPLLHGFKGLFIKT